MCGYNEFEFCRGVESLPFFAHVINILNIKKMNLD